MTGGALVAYGLVMFSPFLLAGTALLLLGPVVVAVAHRFERGASGAAERADGWPVRGHALPNA